jgi:hypothetical protein
MRNITAEVLVATLDAAQLAKERAHPNHQRRTRRPEVYQELVRDPRAS